MNNENELDLSIPTDSAASAPVIPTAAADNSPKLAQNLRSETRIVLVGVSKGVVHLLADTKAVRQGQGADYHNFPLCSMQAALIDGRKTLLVRDYRGVLREAGAKIRAMVPTVRAGGSGLLAEVAAASGGSDAFRVRDGVKVYGAEFRFGTPIVHAQMPSSARLNAKSVDDPNKGTGYSTAVDDRHPIFVAWGEQGILADYLDGLADGTVFDSGISKSIATRRAEFVAEAEKIAAANGYLLVTLSGDDEYVPAPVSSDSSEDSSETPPATPAERPTRPGRNR
jgi:hypothetical protein